MNKAVSILLLFVTIGCRGQFSSENESSQKQSDIIEVGGPFENKELVYVDMPEYINSIDTTLAWNKNAEKLIINGRVLNKDGSSSAKDVILYYYHTNREGVYPTSDDLNPQAAKHGYLRGWVKTDDKGHFTIYTGRPGSYPNSTAQAHIHVTVKEPNNLSAYYVDEIVFDDDPYVTDQYRKSQRRRGGSGILSPEKQNGYWTVDYSITLGLNIPDYPKGMH